MLADITVCFKSDTKFFVELYFLCDFSEWIWVIDL